MTAGFVHLHVHSEHSEVDGIARVPDIFGEVAAHGMRAAAITDHGTLAAIYDARIAAKKAGVKFIPGIEAYLAASTDLSRPNARLSPDVFRVAADDAADPDEAEEFLDPFTRAEEARAAVRGKSRHYYHLTILATGAVGWKNLVLMHNQSQRDRTGKTPIIDLDLLAQHSEGLIVLTGCVGGPVMGPMSRNGALTAQATLDHALNQQVAAPASKSKDTADRTHAASIVHAARAMLDLILEREDYEIDAAQAREIVDHLISGEGENEPTSVAWTILADQIDRGLLVSGESIAREHLTQIIAAVGKENVYVEVMEHGPQHTCGARALELLDQVRTDGGGRSAYMDALTQDWQTRFEGRLDDALAAVEKALGLPEVRDYMRNPDATATDRENAHRALREAVDEAIAQFSDNRHLAETLVMPKMAALAEEFGLPLVATNDSHYSHAEDEHAHEAWLAARTEGGLTNPKAWKFHGEGFFVRSEAQMRAMRPEQWWQDACDTTVAIAERVEDDFMPPNRIRLPQFDLADTGHKTSRAYLRHLVIAGAKERYGAKVPQEVKDRIEMELGVIDTFKVWDYMLIVWEFLDWARKEGIRVGPGRGSAAGSVIAYCLRIVDVDPIRHGLLFERFLDITRIGLPDIDSDIEKRHRARVVKHLLDLYGTDKVARIGTVGVVKAKAAIDRASRALGLPPALATKVRNAVPMDGVTPIPLRNLSQPVFDKDGDMTARTLLETPAAATMRELLDESPDAQRIIDLALRFEDVAVSQGIHACGVVISDEPLDDFIPMRRDLNSKGEDATLVTEWSQKPIEDMGLVKMDVLGLRNLDVLATAAEYVNLIDPDSGLDLDNIPDPDDTSDPRVAATHRLLANGNTAGVFQMDSGGMTELAQDVVPHAMGHWSDLVALYRPGPMEAGSPAKYADRKNGRAAVDYSIYSEDEDEQKAISLVLSGTYGLTVYQEQAMALGAQIAGFGPRWTNRLRKAISKKNQAVLDDIKARFILGCTQDHTYVTPEADIEAGDIAGVEEPEPKMAFSRATAEALWRTIEGAGRYAFNKCLAGSTLVQNGSREEVSVEALYRRLHGQDPADGTLCRYCHDRTLPAGSTSGKCSACRSWRTKFDDSRGLHLLAVDSADGRVRPQRVADVHLNGVRETYRVTLSDGRSVEATDNHRFMLADGTYAMVSEMTAGQTELATDGGYQAQEWDGGYRLSSGERSGHGRLYARGEENIGYIDGGSVALREWTERTREGAACDECGVTGPDTRLERAHLDGDRTNNQDSNLAWKCVSHHKQWDYANNDRRRRWGKGGQVTSAVVVSIEPCGEQPVYDVEMADGTDHNFFANGIVSHNSHSMAYGYLAFQTAYVKANWPAPYGAAVLARTDSDKPEKRNKMIRSLQAEGITIQAPDLATGHQDTTPVDGRTIVLGLGEIKGVGEAVDMILRVRDRKGSKPFASLGDAMKRTSASVSEALRKGLDAKGPTRATWVALVESGACDGLSPYRDKQWTYSCADGQHVQFPADAPPSDQQVNEQGLVLVDSPHGARKGHLQVVGALGVHPDTPVPDTEFGVVERAARQQARMGLILGTHPMRHLADVARGWNPDIVDDYGHHLGAKPKPLSRAISGGEGSVLTVAMVTAWKPTQGRAGARVHMELEGTGAAIEAVIWPRDWSRIKRTHPDLGVGSVLGLSGNLRVREIEQRISGDDDTEAAVDEDGNEVEATHTVTVRSLSISEVEPIDFADPGAISAAVPGVRPAPVLDDAPLRAMWSLSGGMLDVEPQRQQESAVTVLTRTEVEVEPEVEPEVIEAEPVPDTVPQSLVDQVEHEKAGTVGNYLTDVIVVPKSAFGSDLGKGTPQFKDTLSVPPMDFWEGPMSFFRVSHPTETGGKYLLVLRTSRGSDAEKVQVPGLTDVQGQWAPTISPDWERFVPDAT